MRRLIARRLAQSFAVVFLVATATFVLVHAAPGDPIGALAADSHLSEAVRDRWRAQAGLDKPLAVQYALYLRNIAVGNFGFSVVHNRWVIEDLADRIPNTLLLMATSIVASIVLGVIIGVMQAISRRSWLSRVTGAIALVLYSMPSFWLALVIMLLFAVHWGVLPTSGMCSITCDYAVGFSGVLDVAKHLVLPASTLTLLNAAGIARYQRGAFLEVMHEDYVRTARAKGVSEHAVLWRHVFRNALLPVISIVGLYFPALLGGAVFVERVFSWPGLGQLAVEAVSARDYPIVLAVAIIGSAMVCIGSLLADVLYAWANPRVRVQ